MNEAPRFTFEEHGHRSSKSYRFFADRIELDWKAAFRSGREIYPVTDISGEFAEQETFAYGSRSLIRSFVLYLVIALVLQLGFTHELLHLLAYILYAFAAGALGFAISMMKKEKWVYVKKRDGRSLFCVCINGLRGISREDFEREIKRYAQQANQPTGPTSESAPR